MENPLQALELTVPIFRINNIVYGYTVVKMAPGGSGSEERSESARAN
jgi:hypothetical protein